MNSRSLLLITAVLALIFSSCVGRSALRLEKLVDATLRNDFIPAIESIRKNPRLYGKTNRLLYNLDIGVLFHYAGLHDSSSFYLLRAADIYDELFTRSVTNEAAAVLINDNVRPYRSKPFELAMLHQYVAFNYLAANRNDEALVEARRMQLLFNEWERKDRKGSKYSSDGMFHYITSIAYDAAGEPDNSMISLYKSIQAFQNGPVPLPPRVKDHAYYMFLLNDRAGDNDLLKIKANTAKSEVKGVGNDLSEIIFIGYAGRGPALDENVWSGTYIKDGLLVVSHTGADGKLETVTAPAPPIPDSELKKAEKGEKTNSGTTFHIKFALPALKTYPSVTSHFSVNCSGYPGTVNTIIINDLEKQAAGYLEDTRPETMTRTIIRVVLRTIAAQRAKANMKTDVPLANLLLNVGTDILADQMERADTRTCFLMPKTIQIARVPVKPGTYSVDVAARDRSGQVINSKTFSGIEVKAHEKQFVFYSSFR